MYCVLLISMLSGCLACTASAVDGTLHRSKLAHHYQEYNNTLVVEYIYYYTYLLYSVVHAGAHADVYNICSDYSPRPCMAM